LTARLLKYFTIGDIKILKGARKPQNEQEALSAVIMIPVNILTPTQRVSNPKEMPEKTERS
jgi:hypothetical protein